MCSSPISTQVYILSPAENNDPSNHCFFSFHGSEERVWIFLGIHYKELNQIIIKYH